MKLKNIIAALLALVGLGVAAGAVYLCLTFRDAGPIMLTPPEDARDRVEELMEAVCSADYEGASACIWGTPSLGVDREAADVVGALFWDAFEQSKSYTLVGDCTASNEGLSQKVELTCLDIQSLTKNLHDRTQALLDQRVTDAVDTSEVYDEFFSYREEFIMETFYMAAEEALEKDAAEKTIALTLNLVNRNGQWWVLADDALLGAISGGMLY